jgi:hypothetical protein
MHLGAGRGHEAGRLDLGIALRRQPGAGRPRSAWRAPGERAAAPPDVRDAIPPLRRGLSRACGPQPWHAPSAPSKTWPPPAWPRTRPPCVPWPGATPPR